ncbi:MAG: hypothetical protein QOD28_936, partial [Acidobacteriota bacterium]|nr:hypothetical protein [Acidobacteriota bacterium]
MLKLLRISIAFSLVALVLLPVASHRSQAVAPAVAVQRRVTLVLTNGKIFTADGRGTIAESVAVDNDRIVAVGTNA